MKLAVYQQRTLVVRHFAFALHLDVPDVIPVSYTHLLTDQTALIFSIQYNFRSAKDVRVKRIQKIQSVQKQEEKE